MPVEKRVFASGMDLDSDDRLVPQGFYRESLNVRAGSSNDSDVGALENVVGNELVSLNFGGGTVIGSHRSEERNSIIYFVYDPTPLNGSHAIIEYYDDDTSKVVLKNTILNFSPDYLITGINDINGLLYWTDDYNPPRKINIDKAILHTQSQGTDPNGYSQLLSNGNLLEREQFINAIKAQPIQRPSFYFSTDSSRDHNYVRKGYYFKFKYRYVYDDDEKSAWSSISDLSYTDYDILQSSTVNSPESYGEVYLYNCIVINLLNGHETVKRIEVAASESESDFFLIADIERVSGLNVQSVMFYNDEVYPLIEVNDSIKPYDDVPRLAKAQELIDGNKIVYGNYLSGYDHHNVRCSFSPEFFEPNFFSYESDVDWGITIAVASWSDNFEFASRDTNDGLGRVYKFTCTDQFTNPENLKQKLIDAGYEINPGMAVEIEYSLGFQASPYSSNFIDISNELSEFTGPNTTTIPVTPDTIVISIPTSVDDPYIYLAEQLIDYQFVGSTGSYNFMRKGGIWRRYNTGEGNVTHVGIDDICEIFDDEIGYVSFFNGIAFYTEYGEQFNDWYYENGIPGISVTNDFLGNLTNFSYTGNDDNGKTEGFVGVRSFRMKTFEFSPNLLEANFGFPQSNRFTSFKAGTHHTFGIVYHDDYGRFGFVNQPRSVYIPHINNRPVEQEGLIGSKIRWSVYGYAPSWAKYYSWFYAYNNKGYDFLQFTVKEITETSNVASIEGGTIRMTLKPLDDFQKQNESTIVSYDFAQGDKIRFLRKPNGDLFDVDLELPILSAVDGTDGEYIISMPISNEINTINEFSGALVEIYKKKPQSSVENKVFREISSKYPITQISLPDGQVVGLHSQETGIFNRGDIYLTKRVIFSDTGQVDFMCETPNVSDFTPSNIRDGGKANAFDKDQGEERYISNVTYSFPYIRGTRINGLSSFNPVLQPYKEYDSSYGSIQKLFSKDNSLVIFQEDKVSQSQVSRNIIFDNQGNATFVGTVSNTLSDAIAYSGEYGISYQPESFAVFGERIYFTDAKRGSVLRISRDGITPISNYKMRDYFMDLFSQDTRVRIYGGYDPRFDEYIVSVDKMNSIGFSESSNIWTSFYSFSPEGMQYMYKDLYSFKNGAMYKHNSSDTYNLFYGVKYPSQVKFVFNASPSSKKVYNALSIEGNASWDFPNITTPSGQSTYLSVDNFDEREGFYYSDIMCDINTNVSNPLFEGNRMRDYALIVEMTNDEPTFVELYAVNANYTDSFRHNG